MKKRKEKKTGVAAVSVAPCEAFHLGLSKGRHVQTVYIRGEYRVLYIPMIPGVCVNWEVGM